MKLLSKQTLCSWVVVSKVVVYFVQRQDEELTELKTKLSDVQSERDLLSTQIAELLQKMETMSATGDQNSSTIDVDSQREILALQKKV